MNEAKKKREEHHALMKKLHAKVPSLALLPAARALFHRSISPMRLLTHLRCSSAPRGKHTVVAVEAIGAREWEATERSDVIDFLPHSARVGRPCGDG